MRLIVAAVLGAQDAAQRERRGCRFSHFVYCSNELGPVLSSLKVMCCLKVGRKSPNIGEVRNTEELWNGMEYTWQFQE
jgi:hypothetical protein